MLIHRWTPDKFFSADCNIRKYHDAIVNSEGDIMIYNICMYTFFGAFWYTICTKFAYKYESLAKKWVESDDTWTDVGFLRNKVYLSPVSRARSKVVIITVSIDGCN